MKKFGFILLHVTSVLLLTICAAAQTPTPTPPVPDADDVVKITTNLIQLDATVTDKNGKIVTDLTADDFEIYENGEKQPITNFSFVSAQPAAASEKPIEKNSPRNSPAAPPVPTKLRPEQVRRTIALVVDDLGLSFESTAFVRQALKKFVDEQMQPNDLVAIVRTSGGIGALQSFTSDKRQLYAAIEKVRFSLAGRAGVSAFSPIEATPAEIVAAMTGDAGDAERAKQQRQSAQDSENFRTDIFAVGTLGALQFIVKGMRELPGRKSVILMSDGFRIFNRDVDGRPDASQRILSALRGLTDLANRASVVVNTIDARGLQTLGLTAADNTAGLNVEQLEQRLSDRRSELFDTQDGLNYLAQQTGGRAFRNNNDIKGSIQKVLDDQQGFYLLGYQPDGEAFDPAKLRFNKISVRVKRPGLTVRYRNGFLSRTDETAAAATTKLAPIQRLVSAVSSPFAASGIELRLNALFGDEPKTGSFIRSLIYINAKDIRFADDADNMKKAVFDVLAYTFGDNGVPVDSVAKTYTLRVKNDDSYRRLLDKGLIYYLNVPVKKPGAYQLRVALRDAASERIGAANQFVEVPNLKKDRLALSGLVLQNLTAAQFEQMSAGQAPPGAAAGQDPDAPDLQTDTALRRFRRGTVLWFGYSIYNARLDAARQPQLTTQTRVFSDGKLIFEGEPTRLNIAGQTDFERLNAQNAVALPMQMQPGDYVLQIVVSDTLAKEKRRIATQWIDFEVTP